MSTPPASSSQLQSAFRSPLSPLHESEHVILGTYHGAEVPLHFTDPLSEYKAVRAAAGLFDYSFRARFTLLGEHRTRFLHRIISNDVKNLAVGHGIYATLLNAQGRILSDFYVFADEDRLWVDTDADLAEKTAALLRRYIIGDRVEIEASPLVAISLQGPQSASVLDAILEGASASPENIGVPQGVASGTTAELEHRATTYADKPARIVRRSSTGETGFELWLDPTVVENCWRAAIAAGATPCGTEALEILRIEAGIPRYGSELAEDTLPLEAGLVNALSFNKGCYIGQEIVERMRSRGHANWKLVGLRFAPDAPMPAPGEQLTASGQNVGEVTSACYSPTFAQPLAMAYARREVSAPGTAIALQSGTPAEACALPFEIPIHAA